MTVYLRSRFFKTQKVAIKDRSQFGKRLTGSHVNDWAELLSIHIHNPCIRYFHHVLANTVFGRVNNNKVNAREMYFLHYTFTPNLRINVDSFLLNHIQSLLSRNENTSPFCIWGIVTAISQYLDLQDRLDELPFWQAEFLDVGYC
jgi:hypothetical protein